MVLEPHLRAPVPIHGPDRCFRDQTVGRARRNRGIELHQMLAARNVLHSVLHELDRLVVLQAEEAAGPMRLPWRRRWRIISSSSPSKPNIVHFIMNSCGPVGTIWRTPSVFISRWMIRFGQMVAIVTDQGLSNSSMK